ncbi:MAG TPA: hypothetical protein VJ824_02480 [Bacillota bacterium]|nr:hypothetical protein [Bacillota bacterium]
MKWFRKLFWRKNRLKVWKARLTTALEETTKRYPLGMPIDLHISWGTLYNGSAWFNHKRNKATIFIQIPYDRHLTKDDQAILTQYQLSIEKLPQFILNHEYFHLLDVRALKGSHLRNLMKERQKLAENNSKYHQLMFEEQADQFAWSVLSEKIEKAC